MIFLNNNVDNYDKTVWNFNVEWKMHARLGYQLTIFEIHRKCYKYFVFWNLPDNDNLYELK